MRIAIMAAVTTPETTMRVRHPLDAVRSHIRRYVVLETAAAVVFFIALWFWIGLFIDFGAFWTLAYDWVLELNFIDAGSQASRGVRIGIFACLLGWLGYLVVTKFSLRMWKEFSDPAVALVLERRFPKELGDRLITAVELADPKKAESYGYSGQMLAQTINEAAERVEKVPVEQVFDWDRLKRLWYGVALVTIGAFVLVMGISLGVQAARGQAASPVTYLWRFKDNAAIWAERNILFQNSYWLRHAQLEVVRFQDNDKHPGEMRVGRDEQRPDLVVRAVSWVAPDAAAIGGWRALTVAEAASFVSLQSLPPIAIPADWPGWIIDLDDLDPAIPTGIVPAAWQGKTAGEVAKELAADEALKENLGKAGALKAVAALGDWKTWTFDKLIMQIARPDVQKQLEAAHSKAIEAIRTLEAALEEVAASPSMNRRLRKLAAPSDVDIVFRGATTKSTFPGVSQADRKFSFSLADLKESATFFVRGDDYFTAPLKITLAPPPAVREITIDKEEPAYLYHWLGGPQAPLKGKKQVFLGSKVSVTGETSMIDVPLGANLTLKALVDRPLKDGVRIAQAGQLREAGIVVPENPIALDKDRLGFSVRFDKVDKTMDFVFEFHDEDNVKGKRRIRIRPVDDQAPEILNFELSVVLRKPRFKDALARSLSGSGASEGLLVTPDALLPVAGTVRDDVALTDVRWLFETQPITIEAGSDSDPGRVILQGTPTLRRTRLVVSTLQFSPFLPQTAFAAAPYLNFMARIIELDLKQKQVDPERSAPLGSFQKALAALEEESPAQADERLREKPAKKPFLRELVLKDSESFGVKEHLPDLKMKDAKTQAQIFYMLKLSVGATDNNVETGPGVSKTRVPIFLLVVPEIELLAQIGLEEEALRDRLEKVIAKLKVAQTIMAAQAPTLRSMNTDTDYSLVVLRVDEVRKALLDTSSASREIFLDYSRILEELKVNRVKKDKILDVRTKIVEPLELIVDPQRGSFLFADEAVQRLGQALDEDINNKQVLKNLPQHLESAVQADNQLLGLIRELEAIYAAIGSGLDYNNILERAIALERDQRNVVTPLRVYRDQVLDIVLKELTGPSQ
jgi:hypothetical protein